MSQPRRVIKNYSLAFKQKMVSEIETGKYNISQAMRLYDIKGSHTIRDWIEKFGKNHLLNKVVRIEMPEDINRLKTLEQEKQELESALAQAQLKILRLESTLEAANDHYQVDLKKISIQKHQNSDC